MVKNSTFYGLLTALVLLVASCDDNNGGGGNNGGGKGHVVSTKNTCLVYLGVDNSDFYREAIEKRDSLIKYWDSSQDGNMLVFADVSTRPAMNDEYGHLILIGGTDAAGNNTADTVKSYFRPDSSSPEFLTQVLEDVKKMYPAERMGMVVLSHALGWLPLDLYRSPSRALIEDNGSYMELADFAAAIPYKLDYLVCDLCFMGGVEVVYQLRDKVDYVVSSPAEVLVPGFDYTKLAKRLFTADFGEKNVSEVAYDFYYYYASRYLKDGYSSATVSVVKTSQLEALADYIRENDIIPWMGAEEYISKVQNYYPNPSVYFYSDLGHLIEVMYADDATVRGDFKGYLENAVVYKENTPNYYSAIIGYRGTHFIEYFSGLTVYIPRAGYPELNDYYKGLDWYKAVYPQS